MMQGALDWLTKQSPFRGSSSVYSRARANVAETAGREMPPSERYALQRAYYSNNRLYEDLARALYDQGIVNRVVRGLRNPAFRIVEFYPAVLWPGDLPDALPMKLENRKLEEPIHQVWKWSNWARKKQVYARWLAMLGDAFIKVVRPDGRDRVYFELIDPMYVTDFETDERGNVIACRIDMLKQRKRGRDIEEYHYTEHWSRDDGLMRIWEHNADASTPLEDLGTPRDTRSLEDMGIDFVPIAYVPFNDIGEHRGAGSFWFQLDKIDQLNAEATRLSQMLFRHNKQLIALLGGRDPSGRALPPPKIVSADGSGNVKETLDMTDETILTVSGGTDVRSLVPDLNYEAHLNLIEQQTIDLQQDCPEMAYWKVVNWDAVQISGRALNYILGPAQQRAIEVRGNGEDGMIRAMEMALTLGQVGDQAPFSGLGDYKSGDFEHTFVTRPVIAMDDLERAQGAQAEAVAVTSWTEAGLAVEDALALVMRNLSEKDMQRIVSNAVKERERKIEEQRATFGGEAGAREGAGGGQPPQRQGNQRGRGTS